MTKRIIYALQRQSRILSPRIIYASHSAKAAHEALGFPIENTRVILNGVDISRFQPNPSAREYVLQEIGIPEGRREETLLIGRFARLDPMKDYPSLLRAFAHFHKQRPMAALVCVGKGVTKGNSVFASMVRDAGAPTESVYALGFREDVALLMAGMDITVSSSSRKEAWPLAIAESMACAVPCIATDIGDSVDILGNRDRIVPVEDCEALGAVLEHYFSLTPERRKCLGQEARERVASLFPLEKTVEAYAEEFYSAVSS